MPQSFDDFEQDSAVKKSVRNHKGHIRQLYSAMDWLRRACDSRLKRLKASDSGYLGQLNEMKNVWNESIAKLEKGDADQKELIEELKEKVRVLENWRTRTQLRRACKRRKTLPDDHPDMQPQGHQDDQNPGAGAAPMLTA